MKLTQKKSFLSQYLHRSPFFSFFFFFALNLSTSERSRFDSLFTNEDQKKNILAKLVRDVFGMFVTDAGLVYDVTNTDGWAQNGSTQGHVLTTFKRRLF